MGEREKMLAGEPYAADDAGLVAARRHCREALRAFAADEDHVALGELLGALGPGTQVVPPLHLDYGANLELGSRTFVNAGLVALDCARITVGDDVQIGPGVQLLTPEHPTDPVERVTGVEWARPIVVEDGAWLGGGAIVLAGVTIGTGAVVGAGAVVTRDVAPGTTVVGQPARVVRPRYQR